LDSDLFERLEREDYSVFKNKRVLDLSFVPDVLVGRGFEEKKLARILVNGVREGFFPPMVRVFGNVGCGKTVVVRSVLERFLEYKGDVFRFFYVNLKNCRTVFSAANCVLSSVCGRRLPVNLGLDRVFSELWDEVLDLKKGDELFLCFVLDEVDSIFLDLHFDPSDFFYRFLRASSMVEGMENVRLCLITITNNPMVLENNLDSRVKSSMGNEVLVFRGYSKNELRKILENRAKEAFKSGVLDDGVLDFVAKVVADKGGDARKAIDLLRVSGEVACEKEGKVDEESVRVALGRVERDFVNDLLNGLSVQSKLIVYLLAFLSSKTDRKITVSQLYKVYADANVDGAFKKVGQRRVLEIIKELETLGLVSSWSFSRGRRGFAKEIVLNRDPRIILDFFDSL
jgi:archaeal cell division control protein 6